ncbi:Deoxycytidine monophosphate (dCMP) deaminase [Ceratobasidium sp. UAMH 11750]|nr:Deoxycytidine monophosphate (dCMP) deaminase [Ceratobasidium sp. UAMH 11750]
MLICIVGTQCSGKASVRTYLEGLGFQNIRHDTLAEPSETTHCYADFNTLLNDITWNWQKDFVCTSITNLNMLRSCAQRPFFVLVSVDAPVLTRWKRCQERHPNDSLSLEDFIQQSDVERFGPQPDSTRDPLNDILRALPHVSVTNNFSNLSELYAHLDSLALRSSERIRPGWDDYFMLLASLASLRCNCMKRRVGAVLVRNKRVVSTGYNGTPRGLLNCNEGGCKRCNGTAKSGEAYDSCLCLHAEENALLEAGRDRVGENATLYCNTCPCLRCTIKIVQSGVKEVVYNKSYSMDEASANIFREAGVHN